MEIFLSLSLPTSMARGLTFTTVGLTVLIALVLVHPTCCASAMVDRHCTASSCGNIHNISFPFRFKRDPKNCGYPWYELSCENNRMVRYLRGGKYYVQVINYSILEDNYFFDLHPEFFFISILFDIPSYHGVGDEFTTAITECGFDEL